MPYDELIKRLRETSEWSNIKWEDYSDDAQETMREAADAIEELSKPKWISVGERLPEKKVWVLCACRANIFCVLRWDGIDWYENPTHIYMSGFVTHWMQLPEPPKEERA